MKRYRALRLGDPALFWAVALLAIFGIAMIYSAGVTDVGHTRASGAWRQQIMWFCLSMIAIPFVLRIPVGWLEWGAQPAYALSLVLLVLVKIIGRGGTTAPGVESWLVFGPVRFQPAEIAKI